MTNYRRNFIQGGSYFFTLTLVNRKKQFLTDHIDFLRKSFRKVKKEHPYEIDAIVVLPEHLHCIWTLPTGDSDFSTRWKKIKSGFSRGFPKTEERSKSRVNKGERGLWQRRYWEHTLRNEEDFIRHVEYIHYNPVKHGYVSQVREWPYSSFHRFVNEGKYPLNWAGDSDNEIGCVGE